MKFLLPFLALPLLAQDAVVSVNSQMGLINDPTPFYTLAIVNGQRSVVSVRFTNFGKAVKVETDPILRFTVQSATSAPGAKPDSAREGGEFSGGPVDPFVDPDPDVHDFDPDYWPDPEDDFLPPPPLAEPFDDPFDGLPEPPPLDPDLDGGSPGEFSDAGGEQLGFEASPLPGPQDRADKERNAVAPEADDAPFDPPLRNMEIFTTNRDSGGIQRLQVGNGSRVVANISSGAKPSSAVRDVNGTVYVSNFGSGTVSVIQGNAVIGTINLPGSAAPDQISISRDAKTAYIGSLARSAGSVYVVDLATRQVTATIPVGKFPAGMALTKDGSQLWVSSVRDNDVRIIDTATNTQVGQLINIRQARGIAFSRSGTRAYIASYSDNLVHVIDTATLRTIARTRVGTNPQEIRVSPSGRHIFVTNFGGRTISQIDSRSLRVIRNIEVGDKPIGVVFIRGR